LGIAVEAVKAAAAEGENLGFATREPPQGEEETTLTISISSTEKKENPKLKNPPAKNQKHKKHQMHKTKTQFLNCPKLDNRQTRWIAHYLLRGQSLS
jgi:hypothetical protein